MLDLTRDFAILKKCRSRDARTELSDTLVLSCQLSEIRSGPSGRGAGMATMAATMAMAARVNPCCIARLRSNPVSSRRSPPRRWTALRASGSEGTSGGDFDEDDVGSDDPGSTEGSSYRPVSDAELKAAIAECRELLEEATRIAGEQARAELAAQFLKVPEGATGGNLAVDMARVQLFFQGKGMRPYQAERVSTTIVEIDSIYGDVELLAVKYDRLTRTLPDVDVKEMVFNDPKILTVKIADAVPRLIDLLDIFPLRKVPTMIAEAPKLLYGTEPIPELFERTCECIKRVYPKETEEGCVYAISEEPTLMFDLPDLHIFKKDERIDIAELPMAVQESLVYATRNEHE